jgi:hypothetical protein
MRRHDPNPFVLLGRYPGILSARVAAVKLQIALTAGSIAGASLRF